jgi:hypothetical protein
MLDAVEDKAGPVMADRTLAHLRKAFNWQVARDDDFLSPIVRGMARTKPKERARQRVLTDDEIRDIWQALETADVPSCYPRYIKMLLLTMTLHNVDDAARRRFNIVPFMRKPDRPDPELERKLMDEAGGILQWMIEGCLDWQENGLSRPAAVQAATDAYFSDQDLFGQWIEDCCDQHLGNAKLWDRSADLFDSWTEYAVKAGEAANSRKSFGQEMQRRGFEPGKISGGARIYRGIRLRLASGGKVNGEGA